MPFLSIMKLMSSRSGRIRVRRPFHRSLLIDEWMSCRFVCWSRWFLLDDDRASTESSLSRRMFVDDWERNEWSVENVEWSSCSSSFECRSIVVDGHIIDALLSAIVERTTIVLVTSMDSIEQSNNDFLSIESHFIHFHEQHSTVHRLASSFFDCDNTKMIFFSLVIDSTIGIRWCLVLVVVGRSSEDQHVSIVVFDSVGFEWRWTVGSNIDEQSTRVLHSSWSSADLSIDDLRRCPRHATGHTLSTSSTDLQSLFNQSDGRVDVSSSGLSSIECESLLFVDLSLRSVTAVESFDQSDRWMDMFLFISKWWWWDLSILSRQRSNIHSSIADLRSAWDQWNRNGSMLPKECIRNNTATDHWSTISFHFELSFPNVSIVLCVSGWEPSLANGWTSSECRDWTNDDRCFCAGGTVDEWESHTLFLHSSDDICQWSGFDASTSAMEWSCRQWSDERRTQCRGHHGVALIGRFYRRADLCEWSAARCEEGELSVSLWWRCKECWLFV